MFSPLKGGTDFIMSHNVSFTTTSKKNGMGKWPKNNLQSSINIYLFFYKNIANTFN